MTTAIRYGAVALAALGLAGCTARPAVLVTTSSSAPPPRPQTSQPATARPAPIVTAEPAFPEQEPAGGLHSQAAARQLAEAIVMAVPAPPGATLQTASPPSRLTPGPTVDVDTKVDLERWYTLPGSRDAAIAWLDTHGPAGFRFYESQTVSGPGAAASYPRFLSLGSDTPSRQPLGITQATVLQDGNDADVRISVEVLWAPNWFCQPNLAPDC